MLLDRWNFEVLENNRRLSEAADNANRRQKYTHTHPQSPGEQRGVRWEANELEPKPRGLCGRVYITFLRSVALLSYTPHTLVLG